MALHDLGRLDEFEAALTELRDTWGNQSPLAVATVYAYTNAADAAFEWLERVLDEEYHPRRFSIVRDPWFRNLHSDPRWEQILERLGVAPGQLETLDFQLTLPDYIRRAQNRS